MLGYCTYEYVFWLSLLSVTENWTLSSQNSCVYWFANIMNNKLSLDGWPDVWVWTLSYLAKDVIWYDNISDQGGLFFSYIAGGVEPLGMVTDLTNIITLELVCDQVCFASVTPTQYRWRSGTDVWAWSWAIRLTQSQQSLSYVLCIIITSSTRFGLVYSIKKSNSNKFLKSCR